MSWNSGNAEDEILPTSAATTTSVSKYLQAIFLIAGTTVGGGFLALPATVVVPLGGFLPSAGALVLVWSYLLICSLILCDSILLAQKSNTKNDSIGIPKTAQTALGQKGSRIATVLLVSLTISTLVSQLSRAGSLFASQLDGSLFQYRVGCILAALLGITVTYKGATQEIDGTTAVPSTASATSFADKFNAVLTVIFLSSALLLFHAVAGVADWSACWQATTASTTNTLLPKILGASPIMLQLLVYGEILPNVCRMLDFDRRSIRRAVLAGSTIPLILLTGWAALGVALIPNGGLLSTIRDPVDIILATGSSAVQSRLLTLAVSAIGTTILGSFLALQSAYDDWKTMLPRRQSLLNQAWIRASMIASPPLLISLISPSIFLQAIDFAGSYPVLLLYGVLPPLMMHRLRDGHKRVPKLHVIVGAFSAFLIGLNVLSDGGWLLQKVLAAFAIR
jgi:tyrosine-specific transport protein